MRERVHLHPRHPSLILMGVLMGALAIFVAACGGGSDDPSPPAAQEASTPAPAEVESAPAAAPEPNDGGATTAEGEEARTPSSGSEAETAAAAPAAAPAPAGPDEASVEPPLELPEEDDGDAPTEVDWGVLRRDLLIELTADQDVELLRRIGEVVGERRGLPLLADVPVYLIRRSNLAEYFRDSYEPDDLLEADFTETLFQLLGVFRADSELIPLLEDLYVGAVLGFYDPDIKSFVIVSGNDHIARRDIDTVTHEFVHALQDQHFDLEGTFDAFDDNSDRGLAFRFIVEGDARLTEALFADLEAEVVGGLEPALDRLPGVSAAVPFVLRRIFNAPYQEGVNAVARLRDERGAAFIDALLADPPDSTEQLLHLPKLATREPPLAVADPDLGGVLGPDWSLILTDTLGEFFLRVLLDDELGDSSAARGADGWGGDRAAAYRSANGAELLAWNLRWDSVAEGDEFFDAFGRWLEARSGRAGLADGGPVISWAGDDRAYWVQRSPAATWIVAGTEADDVDRVAAALSG